MSKLTTEKSIRDALASNQRHFGDSPIRHLLSIIDEQRGLIEMYSANADEAALKAARREADFNGLVSGHNGMLVQAERDGHEFICKAILEDAIVGDAGGNWPSRLQSELRNLRAQVAEARAAGHPVNLFEELAWQLTTAHKADVVGKMETREVE